MPEVGYCRDCKWWEQDSAILTAFEWGSCAMTGQRFDIDYDPAPVDHPESKALADSGTRIDGVVEVWLNTAPDFGCVQFQPKEQSHA